MQALRKLVRPPFRREAFWTACTENEGIAGLVRRLGERFAGIGVDWERERKFHLYGLAK